MEFEFFMNGIQTNLKEKEKKRQEKLQKLLDGLGPDKNIETTKIPLDITSSDSSGSSGDEDSKPKLSKKQKL